MRAQLAEISKTWTRTRTRTTRLSHSYFIHISLFIYHFTLCFFRWTLNHTNLSRTEFVLKTRVQQIRIYRVDVEQSKHSHGITAQTRERPIKKVNCYCQAKEEEVKEEVKENFRNGSRCVGERREGGIKITCA